MFTSPSRAKTGNTQTSGHEGLSNSQTSGRKKKLKKDVKIMPPHTDVGHQIRSLHKRGRSATASQNQFDSVVFGTDKVKDVFFSKHSKRGCCVDFVQDNDIERSIRTHRPCDLEPALCFTTVFLRNR